MLFIYANYYWEIWPGAIRSESEAGRKATTAGEPRERKKGNTSSTILPSPRKPQCSFWFLPLWDFEEEKRRSSFFFGVCCLRIEKLLALDEKCHINRSHTRRRDAAGQLHNLRSLSTSHDFILTYLDRGAVFTIWKVELRKEFQVHSRCHAI